MPDTIFDFHPTEDGTWILISLHKQYNNFKTEGENQMATFIGQEKEETGYKHIKEQKANWASILQGPPSLRISGLDGVMCACTQEAHFLAQVHLLDRNLPQITLRAAAHHKRKRPWPFSHVLGASGMNLLLPF